MSPGPGICQPSPTQLLRQVRARGTPAAEARGRGTLRFLAVADPGLGPARPAVSSLAVHGHGQPSPAYRSRALRDQGPGPGTGAQDSCRSRSGDRCSPADPSRKRRRLRAIIVQPRGQNLRKGANSKEPAKTWRRETGFWSHHLNNWIKPPLKPILLSSMNQKSVLV